MKDELITDCYGNQSWWVNDKLHRVDGPAYIDSDGRQAWFINGKLHRENEPAIIIPDGTQEWFINGKRHRVDGPAIIYADGTILWFTNGNFILGEKIEEWQKQFDIPTDYKNWNKKHKMLFKLRWL